MDDEDLCEQCGRRPASTTARRASDAMALCEECRDAEADVPEAPIAAAWAVDADAVLVEQVWPVAVNLHRYHLERVLEAGIEVPPRLDTGGEDEPGPKP